jgi:hypothetical protein
MSETSQTWYETYTLHGGARLKPLRKVQWRLATAARCVSVMLAPGHVRDMTRCPVFDFMLKYLSVLRRERGDQSYKEAAVCVVT